MVYLGSTLLKLSGSNANKLAFSCLLCTPFVWTGNRDLADKNGGICLAGAKNNPPKILLFTIELVILTL